MEKNIWQQGIYSWDTFINRDNIKGISRKRKLYYNRQLELARSHLFSLDPSYFLNLLPQSEMWRLYSFFSDEAVFLDIETTGVGKDKDITVIGLFDGIRTKTMIRGINLDYKALAEELKRYKLIVTYNGSTFDIPFIKKRYPNLLPNVPNFDLKVACRRLGLTGGLKEIEKRFNIKRNSIVDKFCSGDPLTLWKMYRASGDEYYINLLVEYNEDDCYNLKKIADYVCKELERKSFDKSNQQWSVSRGLAPTEWLT